MVRQPEYTKHHHDGQDELLAAHLPAKLGLPQASQDEHVAHNDDSVWEDESCDRLKCVLKPHLHTGGHDDRCAHWNDYEWFLKILRSSLLSGENSTSVIILITKKQDSGTYNTTVWSLNNTKI